MSEVISDHRAASRIQLWHSYSHILITNFCSQKRGMRQEVQCLCILFLWVRYTLGIGKGCDFIRFACAEVFARF